MKETRVPLTEVKPGEYVYRIGGREIDSRFRSLEDVHTGTLVWGPRGGRYKLSAAGARALVAFVTDKGRPVVSRTATAVVLRSVDGEDK